MDATWTLLFVLLCCQYGISYRIYILPEPGAFCIGVFSGDDCITWSEYSAHPQFADHSTTLIFTPGIYSSSGLSRYSYPYNTLTVANIKRFTIIGHGAQIQFRLSLSNIGEVRMYNLTLGNNPRLDVRNVQSFMMENCTLSQPSSSTYSYNPPMGMYFYNSNFSRIVNSTFIKVVINVQSYSTLTVDSSTFMNVSQATAITGDAYSSVTIHNSRFFNNFATSYGVVYTQGPLEIVHCLFDGNSIQSSNGAVVYSVEDVAVRDSTFIGNNASYWYSYYHSPQYYYTYQRGGSAIRGQRNINIYNCTFSLYTQTSSIIYSYRYNRYNRYHYYDYDNYYQYEVHITNSRFYHSSRSIYSYSNVTVEDSSFYNIIAHSGGGGVVYSTKSVAITNCTIRDSIARYDGGAVYAADSVTIVSSSIVNSESQLGNGGGIYSGNDVKVIDCIMSECSALNGTGGAIYSAARGSSDIFGPNIVLSKSNFSHNAAAYGGVLYTSGHYNHSMEFTDSTFIFNEATGTNITTGGGVGCVVNTTLSIKNSIFNKNVAEAVGGVLDLSFSNVSIEHSSFSQNSAGDNGGVFHVQNYSTNFTIMYTVIGHNSAENGAVFYIRRSNSNIKIYDSKLVYNSASIQGGVMDIRGVTLTMDIDTIIANNTAGSSGNVISACVSKITAYGLEARLDSVYPLYCSIYDEGNGSRSHPMSQTVSTDASTTIPTTEHIGTTSHEPTYDTESLMTTISEGGTTNEEIATTTSFVSISQSSSAATFTSDSSGALHTHSPYEVTTSSPADTTSQLPSDNHPSTTYSEKTTMSNPQVTDALTTIASTETQSNTNEVRTTAASMTETTSSSPIESTSHNGHQDSTTLPTEFEITTTTAITTSMTDSPAYFSESTITTIDMDSSATTDPSKFAVLQVEQDKYNVWQSSQHNLLQVAIISLTVLCIVCTAVCVVMVTLFFVACKKRKGPRLITRGRYKKLSPTDKDQEGSPKDENEIEEYSFSEI